MEKVGAEMEGEGWGTEEEERKLDRQIDKYRDEEEGGKRGKEWLKKEGKGREGQQMERRREGGREGSIWYVTDSSLPP